tara:strand:- start:34 stop:678 length:645 start_codon:yes stop_codon:yes gene_type:complete
MTGDLSKFAPSLSQRYGIDLNVAQGGLPTIGKTEKVGGIEVDKLPEALKNLIKARDQIAADEQERKDNPLIPQTGFTRTSGKTKTEVAKLDDFKPERNQTPSTSVIDTADKISQRTYDLNLEILRQNPELLRTILAARQDEARVVGEEKRKSSVIQEWGAITRAEIARDQALAQSLLATNVLAHTPNMGVIQALNQTAPSVVGAYKMGSPVLGK